MVVSNNYLYWLIWLFSLSIYSFSILSSPNLGCFSQLRCSDYLKQTGSFYLLVRLICVNVKGAEQPSKPRSFWKGGLRMVPTTFRAIFLCHDLTLIQSGYNAASLIQTPLRSQVRAVLWDAITKLRNNVGVSFS